MLFCGGPGVFETLPLMSRELGEGKGKEIDSTKNPFWVTFFNALNYTTLQVPSMEVLFFPGICCDSMTTQ